MESTKTLILSSRHSADTQLLWAEGVRTGWQVLRPRDWAIEPSPSGRIAIYGEPMFAHAIAQQVGRKLLEPDPDWLSSIAPEFLLRRVAIHSPKEARGLSGPFFAKPASSKSFNPGIYTGGNALPDPDDLPAGETIIVSEIVEFTIEIRFFLFDGKEVASSSYARSGRAVEDDPAKLSASEIEWGEATEWLQHFLRSTDAKRLPRGVVLDIGKIRSGEWAVIEANPAFASAIYGAAPSGALEAIEGALVRLE